MTINRKSNQHNTLSLAAIALSAPFFAMSSHSAGLQLMPGSPNFGSAGAGHAALGMGAGSAWANPATMVLVEDQQIGFGIIAAKTDIQFTADDDTEISGGNAGGDIYIPSFAYVNTINEDVSIGFSIVVPFGNSIDYDDDWAGSNVATSASLQTLQAMPAMSYRINEQFTVGFGMSVNQTEVEQDLSIALGPFSMDASLAADDVAYGWTAGALYEFSSANRIGAVYRSQVDFDLTGQAQLAADTGGAAMNWENPASLVVSGFHQVSDKTSLLWDIGRTFYSEFKETNVVLSDLPLDSLNLHRNWIDANRFAVGTHYQLNETVILQAGYAFDESPVETADRSADLPLDDIQRLTAGVIYKLNLNTDLALGIEYADLGKPELTASDDPMFSSPNGRYDNRATAASVSVNYRF
ncbi:MAG: long-chain fatty acid transport protein [Bermanella sp.]|jgi:long-chain fatty acid transport protein